MTVKQALTQLVSQYETLHQPIGWPALPWDEEWKSPCLILDNHLESSLIEGQQVPWRPFAMDTQPDMFERLSVALDTPIHEDIVSYYSTFWSDPIYAKHPDGELSLLFAWNPDELERLRANLIGHALTKQRSRQSLSFFFACTEPDANEFISVMNHDGSVWLEAPGKKPLRQLADDLVTFLAMLEPMVHPSLR